MADDPQVRARNRMVDEQLRPNGIHNPLVLAAMRSVPRHRFVPSAFSHLSYGDHPVPIGWGQTISQPWIVAHMSQSFSPTGAERVLEIGTGSGYQTAVLAEMGCTVFTIEIIHALAETSQRILKELEYQKIFSMVGDGANGWVEHAPFDVILAACAPPQIPSHLVAQLRIGGYLTMPVGRPEAQSLLVVQKDPSGELKTKEKTAVRFVPMTGSMQVAD